jgi:hypothetical protein
MEGLQKFVDDVVAQLDAEDAMRRKRQRAHRIMYDVMTRSPDLHALDPTVAHVFGKLLDEEWARIQCRAVEREKRRILEQTYMIQQGHAFHTPHEDHHTVPTAAALPHSLPRAL